MIKGIVGIFRFIGMWMLCILASMMLPVFVMAGIRFSISYNHSK